jgi:hypothetical protein
MFLSWKVHYHKIVFGYPRTETETPTCNLEYVQEGSVFLEQTLKTAASGTTIEPDQNLIAGMGVLRREEPEVKLAGVLLGRNWHETCITLA